MYECVWVCVCVCVGGGGGGGGMRGAGAFVEYGLENYNRMYARF